MAGQEFKVPVGEGGISALRTGPESGSGDCFIYAPGAGSNLNDGFGEYLARRLAESGLACVRFQFPYMEAGRRGPDSPRVLEEAWRQVIGTVASDASRIVAGGRSMGGRYASMVAAKGAAVDALALFAYPLHPPGNPERPRDGHFPNIMAPTFFCSGTRDSFGTPEELRAAAADVPDAHPALPGGRGPRVRRPTLHRPHPRRRVGRGRRGVLGVVAGKYLEISHLPTWDTAMGRHMVIAFLQHNDNIVW